MTDQSEIARLQSLVEQRTAERDAARNIATKITISRIDDAKEIVRLKADLADARRSLEAVNVELFRRWCAEQAIEAAGKEGL